MPDIEFNCPYCNGDLVAPEELSGTEGTCEGCRKVIRIPTLVVVKAEPSPQPDPPKTTKTTKRSLASVLAALFNPDLSPCEPLSQTKAIDPEVAPSPYSHQSDKPVPQPRQTPVMTMELLKSLEWKRFEHVVAKLFETGGHRTKLTRIGADGGVDIHVYKQGQAKPIAMIQCKAWNKYRVGVKPVRELFGVMAADGIGKGYFVTSGDFTDEARDFAEGKSIKLVTGQDLISKIGSMSAEERETLYELATSGDYTTPSCPSCGRKLVRRISKKGSHPGEEFWGCPGYPRCKFKMRMSRDKKSNWRMSVW